MKYSLNAVLSGAGIISLLVVPDASPASRRITPTVTVNARTACCHLEQITAPSLLHTPGSAFIIRPDQTADQDGHL